MAIWPSDDPAISLEIRRALFPEIGGYSPNETDFLKRSEPEAGPGHGQVLDVWGRLRFLADINISARNRYIGILQAFWRANHADTFTFFDQDMDYHENAAVGNTTAGANQVYTLGFKDVDKAESTLYVNNILVAQGNWQINAGAAAEGADQLQIITNPGAGLPIRLHIFGRKRYICEFVQAPQRTSNGLNRKSVTFSIREY